MANNATEKKMKMYVWVWCDAAKQSPSLPPRDPAEIPTTKIEAKKAFHKDLKGPKLVRLGKAMQLGLPDPKTKMCTIEEEGSTRLVPQGIVLPWYEGLLLLQELEKKGPRDQSNGTVQWEDKLKQTLIEERSKRKDLSSALYIEKKLMNVAVTGPNYEDSEGKEWNHRRKEVKESEHVLEEGQDGNGFFKVLQIDGYLPPWEAFCHPKCGLYQDFYRVRWGAPYSEVDYSGTESGCQGVLGATWEPDECLPPYLDSMRLGAKKKWLTRQQDLEQAEKQKAERRAIEERKNSSSSLTETVEATAQKRKAEAEASDHSNNVKSTVKVEDVKVKKEETKVQKDEVELVAPDAKKAKKEQREDRYEQRMPPNPNHQEDLTVHTLRHIWNNQNISTFTDIKKGWPKHLTQYPKGFSPCMPPGPCWDGCDCMDDQRPQRPWETQKQWLENQNRSQAASDSLKKLEMDGQEQGFVRRRGTVSKMCFFETPANTQHNEARIRMYKELIATIMNEIKTLLRKIPVEELSDSWSEPVYIPACGWLQDQLDYLPVRYLPQDRAAFPSWLSLQPCTGEIRAEDPPPNARASVEVQLVHPEGRVAKVQIEVKPQEERESHIKISCRTVALALKKADISSRRVKACIDQELSALYDIDRQEAHGVSLGKCLHHLANMCSMARAAATGFLP
eukprot:gnl/MRDRNA2_/MRDRNA2_30213_c0_seq2.p1 gnl/MRDRNA2_/MRDRNA2_30213_c0~~gnl/MRDRNA2_/MRDRNA2_30213_c0_seq2.p1  ORF type:complete len:676 (+),score=135.19 gnl/MRDRNA2_/MRDRNA2_30213_c0_seq2:167-2194(+)